MLFSGKPHCQSCQAKFSHIVNPGKQDLLQTLLRKRLNATLLRGEIPPHWETFLNNSLRMFEDSSF